METPTPAPTPALREVQVARISSSPPIRRSSRPPGPERSSTREMAVPLVERKRRSPIPQSRREMELFVIDKIVSRIRLSPDLSVGHIDMLEAAARKARNVQGISPKTEFLANLENGLFHMALEAYQQYKEMEK